MESPNNSIFINKILKQIEDLQLQLEAKQAEYNEALKTEKEFAKIKVLYTDIKQLQRSLKEWHSHLLVASNLSSNSSWIVL